MLRGRMPSAQGFLSSNVLGEGAVHAQSCDSRAPGWTHADNTCSAPSEMQPPGIASRVEQQCFKSGLRIGRMRSCALAQRAGNTSKREIRGQGFAACVEGKDMVNVENCFLTSLGDSTVFAPVVGTLNDLTAELRRDVHEVRTGVCLTGGNADEGAKASRPFQPSPWPPVSQRNSKTCLGLACRAEAEDAYPRLWATETLPDRQASPFSTESLETYLLSVSTGETSRSSGFCPSPEISIVRDNQ